MDAGPCAPLVADPAAGTNVSPQAGVAAAAANIANKRKARSLCMPTARSWFVDDVPAAQRPFSIVGRCFLLSRRTHPRWL